MQWNPSILWTPWGPSKVSCIERCPHFRIDSVHAVVGPVETEALVVDCKVQSAGDPSCVDLGSIGHACNVDSLDCVAASICPVEPSAAIIAIRSDT